MVAVVPSASIGGLLEYFQAFPCATVHSGIYFPPLKQSALFSKNLQVCLSCSFVRPFEKLLHNSILSSHLYFFLQQLNSYLWRHFVTSVFVSPCKANCLSILMATHLLQYKHVKLYSWELSTNAHFGKWYPRPKSWSLWPLMMLSRLWRQWLHLSPL